MSKIKDYLLTRYEEGEICLACSQSYPPNGILFCDDCGMDKDVEQQREGRKMRERCPKCGEYRNSLNLFVTERDGIFCGSCVKPLGYKWEGDNLVKREGNNA